jgi:hypothetical protein
MSVQEGLWARLIVETAAVAWREGPRARTSKSHLRPVVDQLAYLEVCSDM